MVPRVELPEDQRQLPKIFLFELVYPLPRKSVARVRDGHGADGSAEDTGCLEGAMPKRTRGSRNFLEDTASSFLAIQFHFRGRHKHPTHGLN